MPTISKTRLNEIEAQAIEKLHNRLAEQARDLAYQILKEAELDDASEQGVITVDPDLLFQFYILANTKEKAK